MAFDCDAVSRHYGECKQERIKLRNNEKELILCTVHVPLEFVAIEVQGELIHTCRGNRYLLVIRDLFFKLVRTAPLKRRKAPKVA